MHLCSRLLTHAKWHQRPQLLALVASGYYIVLMVAMDCFTWIVSRRQSSWQMWGRRGRGEHEMLRKGKTGKWGQPMSPGGQ